MNLIHPEILPVQADIWRANGQKIVFTNGCFDILHAGHIALLQHAKRWAMSWLSASIPMRACGV